MGYNTPSIDRIAKEAVIFTDYYADQSYIAGRSSFITGQSIFRTGLSKVGLTGAKEGLSFEDRHPIVRQALTTYFVKDMVERGAPDIVDVVSELNEWNNKGFYKGRLAT